VKKGKSAEGLGSPKDLFPGYGVNNGITVISNCTGF